MKNIACLLGAIFTKQDFFNLISDTFETIKYLSGEREVDLSDILEEYSKIKSKEFPLSIYEVDVLVDEDKVSSYFVVGVKWKDFPDNATKDECIGFISKTLKEVFKVKIEKSIINIRTIYYSDEYDNYTSRNIKENVMEFMKNERISSERLFRDRIH